jgi:hypothetical protein
MTRALLRVGTAEKSKSASSFINGKQAALIRFLQHIGFALVNLLFGQGEQKAHEVVIVAGRIGGETRVILEEGGQAQLAQVGIE